MRIIPAKIEIRFRDCDLMGHVNNAVYLNYFEEARLHYFKQIIGEEWDYTRQGMILVKNEITYLKPLHLGDAPEIEMTLEAVGTKSFTFGYVLRVNQEVFTTGTSVLVCYDFKNNKSVAIYPDFLEAFKKIKK